MVVGPLQPQIPKDTGKGFPAAVDVACGLSAGAGPMWAGEAGAIGVDAQFERPCGDLKNGVADMDFGSFEIEFVHAQAVYERLDFLEGGGLELRLDLRLEPPFLAASDEAALRASNSLSAACSQSFQKASTSL